MLKTQTGDSPLHPNLDLKLTLDLDPPRKFESKIKSKITIKELREMP